MLILGGGGVVRRMHVSLVCSQHVLYRYILYTVCVATTHAFVHITRHDAARDTQSTYYVMGKWCCVAYAPITRPTYTYLNTCAHRKTNASKRREWYHTREIYRIVVLFFQSTSIGWCVRHIICIDLFISRRVDVSMYIYYIRIYVSYVEHRVTRRRDWCFVVCIFIVPFYTGTLVQHSSHTSSAKQQCKAHDATASYAQCSFLCCGAHISQCCFMGGSGNVREGGPYTHLV